jgi:hypothetical protein
VLNRSGYVLKKSGNPFVGWQKRYLAIGTTGELAYYASENDFERNMNAKNKFNIRGMIMSLSKPLPHMVDFKVNTGRHYLINCTTEDNANLWFEVIENHYKGMSARLLSMSSEANSSIFPGGLKDILSKVDGDESDFSDGDAVAENGIYTSISNILLIYQITIIFR